MANEEYDWNDWEEAGTEDWSDADVSSVEELYHSQLAEAWESSYENPKNYSTVREMLDELGL